MCLVITQVPLDALRTMNARFPENLTPPLGSRIVRITPSSRAAQPTVLTPGFAAAADPCVSFSGDSILFAGKRTDGERWNIWRMSLLGDSAQAEPTQVTYDMGDCREPFYMALGAITPPEFTDKVRWIGYTSTTPGTYGERGITPATALYCQSLDSIEGRGIVTWRTTFNLSHDFSPTMLADGRMLFTSWRFGEGKGERGVAGLLASNWDGTGLNPFFGVQDGAFVKAMACEFPEDRTVVFVESDGDAPLNAGSLALIRMARPLATHERISDAPGRFLTPHALPDGRMLVSYAADGVNYGIYRYDPDAKRLGPRLFDDPNWADIDPQAIAQRPEPQGRITIVMDSKDSGDIQCLNVYDSDNPRMRRVEKGSVKRVRVIEGLARRESRTPLDTVNAATRVRLIGEAPVQPDGSFYLRVPADTPISFQMLDEHGFSLVSMGTWVWVRRGDMRGCIGCHENKELAPENRVPLALKLLHEDVLLPTPEARMTADFRGDIAPIMSRSCAGCHRANHPTGLDLADDGWEAIYRRLLTGASADGTPLVRPGYARESMLAWRVIGRRLEGTADSLRRMPPGMSLPEDEIRTMCLWIDLGAQFDSRPAGRVLSGDGGS